MTNFSAVNNNNSAKMSNHRAKICIYSANKFGSWTIETA